MKVYNKILKNHIITSNIRDKNTLFISEKNLKDDTIYKLLKTIKFITIGYHKTYESDYCIVTKGYHFSNVEISELLNLINNAQPRYNMSWFRYLFKKLFINKDLTIDK